MMAEKTKMLQNNRMHTQDEYEMLIPGSRAISTAEALGGRIWLLTLLPIKIKNYTVDGSALLLYITAHSESMMNPAIKDP